MIASETLFEPRLSFEYRYSDRKLKRLPPDLVTVLMIAPVNPPYSAGWPRLPTWTSSTML